MKNDDGSPDVGKTAVEAAAKFAELITAVIAAVKKKYEKIRDDLNEYPVLTYAEVIRYFTRHRNDSPKAVKGAMIKEELEDGKYRIIQVFLDKDNNLIDDAEGYPLGQKLKAKTLDSELEKVFKDHNVVIVE